MESIRFVTTNENKVIEARSHFDDYRVEQFAYDYDELQGTLTEIVKHGLHQTYEHCNNPVMIEDSGLFIESLGGFPGPYSAYVEQTVGVERVAELALMEENRKAVFRSVVGYKDKGHMDVFEGSLTGRVVEPRGDQGFAYDPIVEVDERTLAERTVDEKNQISHRGRALTKMSNWIQTLPRS